MGLPHNMWRLTGRRTDRRDDGPGGGSRTLWRRKGRIFVRRNKLCSLSNQSCCTLNVRIGHSFVAPHDDRFCVIAVRQPYPCTVEFTAEPFASYDVSDQPLAGKQP